MMSVSLGDLSVSEKQELADLLEAQIINHDLASARSFHYEKDMKKADEIEAFIAEVEKELQGMPLLLERPGKQDFVLVSAETYGQMVARIHELEEAVKGPLEREREAQELLDAMTRPGPDEESFFVWRRELGLGVGMP